MSTEQTTPRPALELTVHAVLNGWDLDLHLSLPAEKVGAALDRLGALGFTPRTPAGVPSPVRKQARPKVEPVYKPDGTACCPVHKRPLVEGNYGLYCPARAAEGEESNDKGYCALRFAD